MVGTAGRPRVLVLAEAANPEWTSVPLVGWSMADALRQVADVHLVTQVRNREAIERAGYVEGVDFTAIDSEALTGPAWKVASKLRMGDGKGWTTVAALSGLAYPYFERLVWKQFGDEIRAGGFDVVHRVTPVSPATNSPMAKWCREVGVPFVLGPLNGGVPWPKGYGRERREEGEWLSYVRGVYKLIPGRRSTFDAAAVLVASRRTQGEVPSRFHDRCTYLPENAIDPERFFLEAKQQPGPMRVCCIGRLVPCKGIALLIEAAEPLLRDGRMTIDVIGDGPLRADLEAQVSSGGLEDSVRFLGFLPHSEVQEAAAECSVLGFPSIREFGGGAILEGMALGLAPLVVDYGGPGELVTEATGRKVPMAQRGELVRSLRSELEHMADHPELVAELGAAARTRVQELFTWQKKAEQVASVYDWVLGRRPDRPDPFSTSSPPVGSGVGSTS